MNPFAAIDWPTILAFVVVEALFVLLAAPWLIQRRNESRAVDLFKSKLLPLLPAAPVVPTAADVAGALRQAVLDVLPAAPSLEEQAAARLELAQAIAATVQEAVPGAVQLAVQEAVKGRMSALSAAGVDARASIAAAEWALKQAITAHPKGGVAMAVALNLLKKFDKEAHAGMVEAYVLDPNGLDTILEKYGEKLRIPGLGGAEKPKVPGNGFVRV
jgi:hypothetical protein